MLVGLGRHTQDVYYPVLERSVHRPRIGCVVELASRASATDHFLSTRSLVPEGTLFVEEEDATLTPRLRSALRDAAKRHRIGGVIVATPPESHLDYALWAASEGLHLLVDKPLTTRPAILYDEAQAQGLLDDYRLLCATLEKFPASRRPTCLVSTQRRYHPAWVLVRDLIREAADRTNCPVTSLSGDYSDGEWRLPHDVLHQDYHPYQLGFGVLSHSGYHVIDSVMYWIEASQRAGKEIDTVEVSTAVVRPGEQISQISFDDYKRLFPAEAFRARNPYTQEEYRRACAKFGEMDAFITAQFLRAGDPVTTTTIELLHNAINHRGWVDVEDRNLYQGNGRLRHESYVIRQGPFQAIRLVSLQASKEDQQYPSSEEVGGKNHIEVYVFRNREIFGAAEAFRRYGPKDLNLEFTGLGSHLESAKRRLLDEFICIVQGHAKQVTSDLLAHEPSIRILSLMYRAASRRLSGKSAVVREPFTF